MPALNFHKQFAQLVESGKKRQTIRAKRKRPIKKGETVYLYTGMRTKSCRKLGEGKVIATMHIEIYKSGQLVLGNSEQNLIGRNMIARMDGFNDFSELHSWINKNYQFPFIGDLIKWTVEHEEEQTKDFQKILNQTEFHTGQKMKPMEFQNYGFNEQVFLSDNHSKK